MIEGKVLKLDRQEFNIAQWSGSNESGYEPLDDKVLVLTDTHVEVTMGGVALPPDAIERMTMAAEHGTVIAVGPAAFRWSDTGVREWQGVRPKPGDRIYFERYSGQLLKGTDGKLYRVMSQRCIAAISPDAGTEGDKAHV